jgi:hypothetical protein
MTGPAPDPARPDPTSHCPWCSAEVIGDPAHCPSCGAALREEASADIPGVTQLDPAATSARPTARSRGLLGWLSGEYEGAEAAGERSSVEPPSQAVRAEMARLEIEAIQAQLDAAAAEQAASAAEQAVEADASEALAAEPPTESPEPPEPGAPAT